MNELKNELKEAYSLISSLSVSGDCVEVMAAAREHLRKAYKLAEPEKEGEDG